MAAPISFEDKIDYIYNELKAQKRSRLFKIILLMFAVGIIITILNSTDTQKLISEGKEILSETVKPIAKELIIELEKPNSNSGILINEKGKG